MASLRPGRCYHWDSPAFTRTAKNPSDSFITGIPGSKLLHFEMGNKTGKFDSEMSIVVDENIQIRHNALESVRIFTNKALEKNLGMQNFFFKIRVYPHHVIRENTMATGAGADRVQDGMRKSYGKPIGRAARVRKGQKIMSVCFNKGEMRARNVKKILKLASNKLPGHDKIVYSENK